MPKRSYFTEHWEKKLTNTTEDHIHLLKAEDGEELHYEIIGCSDLTTASINVNIGVSKANKIIWLGSIVLTNAGQFYELARPVIVTAGNHLVAGFRGITANDLCVINVNGYRIIQE